MVKGFDHKDLEDLDFEGNELVDLKKIHDKDKFKLLYVELKPGKSVPMHAHEDNDQSAVVLEGEGEYIAGGEKIKVSRGTSWFVKAGVEHSLINKGKSRIKYFEMLI
jgi:quercetin dioxygenase-like cupin family protein